MPRLISRVMTAVLLTAALSAPVYAQGPTYTFTLTGPRNWTWTLPQNPTPTGFDLGDGLFWIDGVSIVGASTSTCDFDFYTSGSMHGCTQSSERTDLYGAVLFGGDADNPTFAPGTYSLSGDYTLTIAVPEPASFALVGAGLLAMGVVACRRRV